MQNTDTQSSNVSLTGFCVIQVTAKQYKQCVKFTELLVSTVNLNQILVTTATMN